MSTWGWKDAGGWQWEAERWFDFFPLYWLSLTTVFPYCLPYFVSDPIKIRAFHFHGSKSVQLEGFL